MQGWNLLTSLKAFRHPTTAQNIFVASTHPSAAPCMAGLFKHWGRGWWRLNPLAMGRPVFCNKIQQLHTQSTVEGMTMFILCDTNIFFIYLPDGNCRWGNFLAEA